MAEKTRLTNEAFKDVQNLAVIEFSMTMHAVADAQAAASLLITFIQGLGSQAANSLTMPPQPTISLDQSILKGWFMVTGVGEDR